jgi:tetratricopeptide (TPR) repeat protein
VRLAGFIAAAAVALAGCTESGVVRVVDGRPSEGRFIGSAAYALFARGAAAEANGALVPALQAFEMAATQDPGSPEIWTRLGALRCRTEPAGPMPLLAREAFDRAVAADPDHGPLYRERARCLASRGAASAALPDAERALALDPDDLDTALVRAMVLDGAGRVDDARRALRSIAARRPTSTAPWRELHALALRTTDAALARESAERLRALEGGTTAVRELGPRALPRIDRALLGDDLPAAQKLALQQRLPGAEVALRAVALGQRALARTQAELVLGADPGDASARIALVAVADLGGDLGAMTALMRTIPRASSTPSPLGRWLFADVLRRRVSAEAALAWLGDARKGQAGEDPLLSATEERVRAALSMP